MELLLAAFIMVVDVICILNILKSDMKEPQKIIWILSVIVFVLLGALAYLLFGNPKKRA